MINSIQSFVYDSNSSINNEESLLQSVKRMIQTSDLEEMCPRVLQSICYVYTKPLLHTSVLSASLNWKQETLYILKSLENILKWRLQSTYLFYYTSYIFFISRLNTYLSTQPHIYHFRVHITIFIFVQTHQYSVKWSCMIIQWRLEW